MINAMSAEFENISLGLSTVEKLSSVARTSHAGPQSVRPEGPYYVPQEPNSFGLPAVESCPGKTNVCISSCYAIGCEQRSATAIRLDRNFQALKQAQDEEGMTELLRSALQTYVASADKLAVPEEERFFRWHWIGDFFSEEYAAACRNVMQEHPKITFLAYTRSFQERVNVLPILSSLPNLHLYLSVDFENVDRAGLVLPDYPTVDVAYMVEYYEDAAPLREKLHRQYGIKAKACPENIVLQSKKRAKALISEKGGACANCRYCFSDSDNRGTQDVVFLTEKALQRSQLKLPIEVPVRFIDRRAKIRAATLGATAVQTD